ncbi:hypothetical protein SDC9_64833 [bioreactor metagenome]|uniref:Uncharacterized protein n=1 Tax=bioreactor metagenome TaxID=1076179 RepID=A0A644XQD3_9ZZZZ
MSIDALFQLGLVSVVLNSTQTEELSRRHMRLMRSRCFTERNHFREAHEDTSRARRCSVGALLHPL